MLVAAAGAAVAAFAAPGEAEAATTQMRVTGAVNLRVGPSTSYKVVTVLAKGTVVTVRGAARGIWLPVTVGGRTGWVSSRYLVRTTAAVATKSSTTVRRVAAASSVTMPTGVTANGIKVANAVRANFPQIATMYGRRAEDGSDHNTGHAVDIMLPDYRNNAALGTAIAEYMRAHASSLGITYVIWNQHIWNIARNAEGWRYMADRGSDNANHKNHVHVSYR